jgi:hypothetical protein
MDIKVLETIMQARLNKRTSKSAFIILGQNLINLSRGNLDGIAIRNEIDRVLLVSPSSDESDCVEI